MGRVWFLRTVLLLFALPGGWFKPVITPNATHLVIPKGGQLELSCHDDAEMSKVRWMREKNRKINGGLKEDGASVILLSSTQVQHMGRYTCENTQTEEKSSIYIYVKVPETVPVISLSRIENVILIQGQEFVLNCSTININHDISLSWSIPYEAIANRSQNSNILPGSREYKLSTGLSIESVKMTDSGVYRCVARNEKGDSTAPVNLEVYEHGFINLTEGEDSVMEVREGESLTLSVEMTSYPRPTKVYWTYNNQQLKNTSEHVITLHNQQYRFISELRLVRVHESEGGIYTFSAYHMYASVNRSFTVHVICKPVIVSQEGPVDGQVRCVASGYPVPKISWYYCEPPHARCSHLLNATQADEEFTLVTVSGAKFGRSEVESRLNVTKGKFHTLECVATTQGEQAYTLFSIREWCDDKDDLSLDTEDLLSFSYQVAKGMDFLTSKNDYLNLSTSGSCEVFVPPDLQRAQRLSSVGSSTASTQPLLQATNDVFLEHQSI
ncbi:hypothetical protein cypCar_00002921 [Cyprinus carpio]|nr:hypothetical protein cypCar_00002921 [Cyprinus carpio]